jgi:CheY-like chemotaxis protein
MPLPRATGPVLVVEDDADVRDALATLLRTDGLQVETAADGQDALDQIATGLRPCLAVVDLLMPRVDGFQFCDALRRDPELADIPVIVCSAAEDPSARLAPLRVAAVFKKPFVDPRQLLRLAHAYCKTMPSFDDDPVHDEVH